MIDIVKTFSMTVNFSKGSFRSTEDLILIEKDNNSIKFVFNFEEQNLNGQNALLKIKHYIGTVKEKTLTIEENKAELLLTNDILIAGNLKMSISLIGTNGEILTSTEYLENIEVKETLGNGEEPSEEEISVLSGLISDVNNTKKQLEEDKTNGIFTGDSAYQVAVKNGFEGTEEEWLSSLIGEKGDTGEQGPKGDTGATGATGNGIASIEKIKTEGLIDTYQINFTDGTSTTYEITNSANRIREWGVRYYYDQSSSKLERLGDAIGMTANATKNGAAVVNDFDDEELFKEIKEVKRDKTTHKLLAVKGDADYDSIDGEVMIDFPDTYWKFEEAADESYLDIFLSNVQKSGYSKVDKFSVGKYPLSLADDGTIQTQSGFPAEGYKSITTWRNLVKEQYGEGACLMDWRYNVITYLYLIEFADFNSQSVLGNGLHSFRYNATTDKALIAETGVNRIIINTTGGNAFVVGQRIMIGTWDGGNNIASKRKITAKESYTSEDETITGIAIYFDGDAVDITTSCIIMSCGQDTGSADDIQASSGCMSNDGKHGCSYRGFERNSIFDWIDGISIKDGVIYECTDPTAYASEVFDAPYEALEEYGIPTDSTSGYIKSLGFDKNHPFCRLPKALGGGSSTYITDYCWCNPSGKFAARVGGAPHNGANAGLFYWTLISAASIAYWACGARVLMYQI